MREKVNTGSVPKSSARYPVFFFAFSWFILSDTELIGLQMMLNASLNKNESPAVAAIANGYGLGGKTISVNFEKKEKLRKLAGKIIFQ